MVEKTILDADKRLSESLLWKLQHEAYTQFGVSAWGDKGVPFYITSNPFTAKQYAHLVLGYLRDCLAAKKLDFSEPVYLLDLGAGTGRFAYLFLKELLSFLEQLNLNIPLCYVLTDIVPGNLAFWDTHPQLEPFFDQGVLDFGIYHHQQKTPIFLIRSQKKLIAPKNPLILIANYFFDTIPQDLFRVQEGKLEEGKLTLSVEGEASQTLDPALINRLKVDYSYSPIPSIDDYYPDKMNANLLLEIYREKFDGISFLFPIGAFQSLEYFNELSKGRLLLLAGDQGVCTPNQIRDWGEPHLSLHGTFSISVSYHAIALYLELLKGKGLLTSFSDPAFVVMAGVLGEGEFLETQVAFNQHFETFEPSDYWKLATYVEKNATLEELLLVVQMGNGDSINFHAFFPKILQLLPSASSAQKKQLMRIIEDVWKNFYPISPEEGDFVMNLGVLHYSMENYELALLYFERSLKIRGVTPLILQNIEACKRQL